MKALVTGGGRGIGANIARELTSQGWEVFVTGRTVSGDHALAGNVDLLVCNAGINGPSDPLAPPQDWWRVFEVNVLGVYLCCHAFAPRMVSRGGGRIVNVASGSAYLPARGPGSSAYPASKAAVHRLSEVLAQHLTPQNVFVFSISPGLVRTAMTAHFADDLPWTPPECAPRLVAALASGEFDALAGRYLHAEHDPPEQLRERVEAILADDLNAIRLRR